MKKPVELKIDKLSAMFEELVPLSGRADTVAGEIVRAINRIGYRYYNDGDCINEGYGKETCNSAARYLKVTAGGKVAAKIDEGMQGVLDYEKYLDELMGAVIEYLEENPQLKTEKNYDDMHDHWIKEDEDW